MSVLSLQQHAGGDLTGVHGIEAVLDLLTERLAEYSALLHGDDRAALLERLTGSSDRKKKFDALRGLDASQKPLFK